MGYPYSYYVVQPGQQTIQGQPVVAMTNQTPRPAMMTTGTAAAPRSTSKLGNVLLLRLFC